MMPNQSLMPVNSLELTFKLDAPPNLVISVGTNPDRAAAGQYQTDNPTLKLYCELFAKLIEAIENHKSKIMLNIEGGALIVEDPSFTPTVEGAPVVAGRGAGAKKGAPIPGAVGKAKKTASAASTKKKNVPSKRSPPRAKGTGSKS